MFRLNSSCLGILNATEPLYGPVMEIAEGVLYREEVREWSAICISWGPFAWNDTTITPGPVKIVVPGWRSDSEAGIETAEGEALTGIAWVSKAGFLVSDNAGFSPVHPHTRRQMMSIITIQVPAFMK
jgi:hypothetical protein